LKSSAVRIGEILERCTQSRDQRRSAAAESLRSATGRTTGTRLRTTCPKFSNRATTNEAPAPIVPGLAIGGGTSGRPASCRAARFVLHAGQTRTSGLSGVTHGLSNAQASSDRARAVSRHWRGNQFPALEPFKITGQLDSDLVLKEKQALRDQSRDGTGRRRSSQPPRSSAQRHAKQITP
jgi:hypothetical protein